MLMPQSKQMKLQWLTIDGRNVPFALPQHWNGDDWTITGVDNPLPTANYIEKNGIMVPVSENNPVPTQLTGSNVEYIQLIEAQEIRGSENETFSFDFFDISHLRDYEVYVRSSLDVPIAFVLYLGVFGVVEVEGRDRLFSYEVVGGGDSRQHKILPNEEMGDQRNSFIPLWKYELGAQHTSDTYIPTDKHFYKKLPRGRSGRCWAIIRLLHGTPSEGSIEVIMKGLR